MIFSAHFDKGEALWDLGLNDEKIDDQKAVSNKILELEKEMDLILIAESFDESLILLKVKLFQISVEHTEINQSLMNTNL